MSVPPLFAECFSGRSPVVETATCTVDNQDGGTGVPANVLDFSIVCCCERSFGFQLGLLSFHLADGDKHNSKAAAIAGSVRTSSARAKVIMLAFGSDADGGYLTAIVAGT